jgi:hypothetical protein
VNLFARQLVPHTQISDQRFQPLRLFVLDIGFPRSQVCCAALQELIPRAGQRCGGHTQFARECFEVFPAQQSENRCKLAFRRLPAPAITPLFGSPSGRPSGYFRGSRSWFSLFAHRHLLVMSYSFSSQFGVQENPRARDPEYLLTKNFFASINQ